MNLLNRLKRILEYDRARLIIIYATGACIEAVRLYMAVANDPATRGIGIYHAASGGAIIAAMFLLIHGMAAKKHEISRRWLLLALVALQSAFIAVDAAFMILRHDFPVYMLLFLPVKTVFIVEHVWQRWMLKNLLELVDGTTKEWERRDDG